MGSEVLVSLLLLGRNTLTEKRYRRGKGYFILQLQATAHHQGKSGQEQKGRPAAAIPHSTTSAQRTHSQEIRAALMDHAV